MINNSKIIVNITDNILTYKIFYNIVDYVQWISRVLLIVKHFESICYTHNDKEYELNLFNYSDSFKEIIVPQSEIHLYECHFLKQISEKNEFFDIVYIVNTLISKNLIPNIKNYTDSDITKLLMLENNNYFNLTDDEKINVFYSMMDRLKND